MPFANFKSVREVSSEDPVHKAENLIKPQQPGKTWKTKSTGEKSAYVILELDEPQQIIGIDIGNEHSAFMEVLVGKAGCIRENFKEILITCSFMTPPESKSSTSVNRVRCFDKEALVETVVPEKWQLIKIICTQPFNKHIQYGVAFIKLHVTGSAAVRKTLTNNTQSFIPEKFLQRKSSTETNGSKVNTTLVKPAAFAIGKFMLREDSPDSETESTASLFDRWKKTSRLSNENQIPPTTAAQIRDASSPSGLRRLSNSISKPKVPNKVESPKPIKDNKSNYEMKKILDRNRDQLLFGEDDDDDDAPSTSKKEVLKKQIEADKLRLKLDNEKLQKEKDKKQKVSEASTKQSEPQSAEKKQKEKQARSHKANDSHESPKKRHSHHSPSSSRSPKRLKTATVIKYQPFNQLLRGVVLVISGIQNPDRADLRSKALAMGAKYKTDWGLGCTHLICAFKNTPKYNQVKGHGKIVTRSWIEKCYALKKYLPWRRYALDSADIGQDESDEEILDESLKPIEMLDDTADDQRTVSPNAKISMLQKRKSTDNVQTCEAIEKSTRKSPIEDESENYYISSGSDTEDEIEKIQQKMKKNSPSSNKENKSRIVNENIDDNIYEMSTEEEDYLEEVRRTVTSKEKSKEH